MSTASVSAPSLTAQKTLDTNWSNPVVVSASSAPATKPVILAGDQGLVHVLWEQDSRIYHALYQSGRWAGPQSIGTGQRPAASLAADGALHVVFSNEFGGVFNVFYVVLRNGNWTLPRLVSKTTGASTLPSLAVDSSGGIHAAWADTTPGFSVIYHGWLEETWLNEPLLNARGTAPALVHDSQQRQLHLAYQGSGISGGPREVFHAQGSTYAWSLPENISISANNESSAPAMACDAAGNTHLVWQEQQGNQSQVRYVSGHRGNWSASERISEAGVDARAPRVVVNQGSQAQVVWRQGNTIAYRRKSTPDTQWESVSALVTNSHGLGNPVIAGDPVGQLHLAWGSWTPYSDRAMFYSRRAAVLMPRIFIPHVQAE